MTLVRDQFQHGSTYILATASKYKVFDYLVEPLSAQALAEQADISSRGAQALLDGLLALNLVERSGPDYVNGFFSNDFLVSSKDRYMGAIAEFGLEHAENWPLFPDAVKSGRLPHTFEPRGNDYWGKLAEITAPTLVPMATAAFKALDVEDRGPFTMLDVGGGSGFFSSVWLSRNANGRAVQVDCAEANRVAETKAAEMGVAERFSFQKGDFLEVDFGENIYDFAVFCNTSHLLSEDENIAVLRKIKKALKTSGTVVLGAWHLDKDRNGDEIALLFAASMIIWSNSAKAYAMEDHYRWLDEVGFRNPTTINVGSAHMLILAEA